MGDKDTSDSLKPWYRLSCKRPCFHDDYLPAFNRSNVALVDTNGRGVEGFTRRGVLANGKEYEVDCIVLATGFESSFPLPGVHDVELVARKTAASGFKIFGRGGLSLEKKWAAGPSTLNSFQSRGFPNMFFLLQAQ